MNRHNECDKLSTVRYFFRRMKLIQQELKSSEIPFNGKVWFLLYSHWEMCAPFHFVVFLRSFLIGEARLPLYGVKKTLNFSTIFIIIINSVLLQFTFIMLGSRPSKRLGSESRLEIMWGMAKYLVSVQKKAREPCTAGSPPQFHQVSVFLSRPLCRRSPPSRCLE